MRKKIIITWKIKERIFLTETGHNLKYHTGGDFWFIDFSCENDCEKEVMIIQLLSDDEEKRIEKVGKFLIEELKDRSNEKLCFIHDKPVKFQNYLIDHPEFIGYEEFGGGGEILYAQDNNPNGLLFESPYLNENAFVNTTSPENIKLKDAVFDEIWDHFAVKKKIEKIILDFHNLFLPVIFDLSVLKQMAKEKRIEHLSQIYRGYKSYHGYEPQHFRDLLADLLKLIVGIKFDQKLETISKPGEEQFSLLSIAKRHSEEMENMFKQLFKESDLGLTADYTRIDKGLKISDFFLGMDEFLKQVFTGDIKDLEQSDFWINHLGPEAEKNEYYFPIWYVRLTVKLDKIYKYPRV
ncbi:MAG: hypothetical protein NT166_03745 [Candidatus Aminicenantes bacterium]|nr:hypothetical protein [Candidatus Aminicenantes bacterium]